MKINCYEAPSVRLFEVKPMGILNQSRDASLGAALDALGTSTSEETTEYGGNGTVNW